MTGSESEKLAEAALLLRQASRVVVFTGAGISAESGIPTFRDPGGFWERFPVEQFGTWSGLLELASKDPLQLAEYLILRLKPIALAVPNPAHHAVKAMENFCHVVVVTQNIDGLHSEAGSSRVLEIHGSLLRVVRAEERKLVRVISRAELRDLVEKLEQAVSSARVNTVRLFAILRPIFGMDFQGIYRPDVVLFGDVMAEPEWTQALQAARECDLVLSVGTSGQVYPAALIPTEAKAHGAKWIHIDPNEPAGDVWLQGRAGSLLPRLVEAAWPRATLP